MTSFAVTAIGKVESPLTQPESAPRQPDEGAPAAWLVFEPEVLEGLQSIRPGDELVLVTWLDRARRDVLTVHPRGDRARKQEGVFSTRSSDRPNPIGLHDVVITAVDGRRLQVRHLEALNGTPIVDVKPVLSRDLRQTVSQLTPSSALDSSGLDSPRVVHLRAVRRSPAPSRRRHKSTRVPRARPVPADQPHAAAGLLRSRGGR